MPWPRTLGGKIALGATAAYVGFWLLFIWHPEWEKQLVSVPMIGPVLENFFIVYLVAVVMWALWHTLTRGWLR